MRDQLKPDVALMPGVKPGTAHHRSRRVAAFRITAALTGTLFLFLAVSNALAPWVMITANPEDTQPELHRWFTAMSGATDLIGAGCLLALALRPRGRELLALNIAAGIAIAALVVVPFSPAFVVLLVVFVPVLATYPYRRDLRLREILQPSPPVVQMAVAAVAAALLLATAAVALGKQIGGTDSAAQAAWWADYAEHATGLALVSLLAVTRRPGWPVLCGFCAAAWLYLGLVAMFVLPDQQGSWGRSGGLAALVFAAFYTAGLSRRPSPLPATGRD